MLNFFIKFVLFQEQNDKELKDFKNSSVMFCGTKEGINNKTKKTLISVFYNRCIPSFKLFFQCVCLMKGQMDKSYVKTVKLSSSDSMHILNSKNTSKTKDLFGM